MPSRQGKAHADQCKTSSPSVRRVHGPGLCRGTGVYRHCSAIFTHGTSLWSWYHDRCHRGLGKLDTAPGKKVPKYIHNSRPLGALMEHLGEIPKRRAQGLHRQAPRSALAGAEHLGREDKFSGERRDLVGWQAEAEEEAEADAAPTTPLMLSLSKHGRRGALPRGPSTSSG